MHVVTECIFLPVFGINMLFVSRVAQAEHFDPVLVLFFSVSRRWAKRINTRQDCRDIKLHSIARVLRGLANKSGGLFFWVECFYDIEKFNRQHMSDQTRASSRLLQFVVANRKDYMAKPCRLSMGNFRWNSAGRKMSGAFGRFLKWTINITKIRCRRTGAEHLV